MKVILSQYLGLIRIVLIVLVSMAIEKIRTGEYLIHSSGPDYIWPLFRFI